MEGEEYPKGGACLSGGINFVGKSQNDALELRKKGIILLENMVGSKSKSSLAVINCGMAYVGAWSDDLICSGLVQAQLSAESWMRETLGFDPHYKKFAIYIHIFTYKSKVSITYEFYIRI